MQIYMKDGKALKINGGGGYLSPKASGETWVLNEDVSVFSNQFNVEFISNNKKYYAILIKFPDIFYELQQDFSSADLVYEGAIYNWTDQAYRTITFLEPPTGDLLAWLQVNGTKQ